MLEGICRKCGETCVPHDEDDTEHLMKVDGSPCGGFLDIAGVYFVPRG